MSNNSLEIVHEGWLTKSPPSKPIWRARWRRRWFVLRHSGELPGQYYLEYYTDRNCRKLKGKIDLDQCEQVDAGLQFENRKQKYQHMFDVKTPKRTYFLAAESEGEMNKWVEYVCHVCRLIAYKEEEEEEVEDEGGTEVTEVIEETESPPVSPTSTISGPYIPISECISGKPLSGPNGLEDLNNLLRQGGYGKLTAAVQYAAAPWRNRTTPLLPVKRPGAEERRSDEFYDLPRQLQPPHGGGGTPPPASPAITDAESVFTDEEWCAGPHPHSQPSVNWETFPNGGGDYPHHPTRRASSSDQADADIGSWSVVRKFGKLTVVDSAPSGRRNQTLPHKPAPPRPPKPFHLLLDAPSHNYLNLENVAARPSRPRPAPAPKETVVPASPNDSSPPPVSPPHTEVVTDETYDFPRSHQQPPPAAPSEADARRHCYTNAAPSRVDGVVFRYDFHDAPPADPVDAAPVEPTSPRSEGSGYSNLPSPQAPGASTPPAVDRGLKPGRKLSDSAVSGSELSPGPTTPGNPPPDVDRKLKPSHKRYADSHTEPGCPLQLAPPPDGARSLRGNRAAPSPTPPSNSQAGTMLRNGHRNSSCSDDDRVGSPVDEEIYFYQDSLSRYAPHPKRPVEIQYLDLDLETDATAGGVERSGNSSSTQAPTRSPVYSTPAATTTVYKTVDFLKTQAFNKTRQKVEEERKQCSAELL